MNKGFWDSLITFLEVIAFVVLLFWWDWESFTWILFTIGLFIILTLKLLIWICSKTLKKQ